MMPNDIALSQLCRSDTEVLAFQDVWDYDTRLLVRKHLPTGEILYADDIIWKQYLEGTRPKTLLNLVGNNAQHLMDMLWQCGLRPTEGAGSAGSLAATQAHLKDMRAIVSKQLKVEL